jgi:hypothetical protein
LQTKTFDHKYLTVIGFHRQQDSGKPQRAWKLMLTKLGGARSSLQCTEVPKRVRGVKGSARQIVFYILAGSILSLAIWINTLITQKPTLSSSVAAAAFYNSPPGRTSLGDIYQPQRLEKMVSPAVIIIHGEDLQSTFKHRRLNESLVSKLVDSGFVVLDVDCGPIRSSISNEQDAINFLKQIATSYGVNEKEITVLKISSDPADRGAWTYSVFSSPSGGTDPTNQATDNGNLENLHEKQNSNR